MVAVAVVPLEALPLDVAVAGPGGCGRKFQRGHVSATAISVAAA